MRIEKLIAKYKDRLIILRENKKYNQPIDPKDDRKVDYPYDFDIHTTQGFIRDLKKLEAK